MMKTKKTQGFTLVEVTVAGSVMVIIAVAVAGLQYIIGKTELTVFSRSISVEDANLSVSSISREIRTARNSDNGSYLLESAAAQEVVFYSDIDYDGQSERVRYFLENSELKKGVIQPQGFPATYPLNSESIRIITPNVRNGTAPLFYYYNDAFPQDTQNNPLVYPADQDSVSLVRLYLRLNTKPDDFERDYVLETYAHIRTIKKNL